MRKYWYRQILIIIVVFTTSVGGGYYLIQSKQHYFQKEVSAQTSKTMVIPGGMPIGIYLETEGVMVLGTEGIKAVDGVEYEPADHVVKSGDYIVAFNHEDINSKNELIHAVGEIASEEVILTLRRDEEYIDVKIHPVQCGSEEYKLGIWVRDNAQGLGTVTYLDADSRFGALGHGIHDVDTNQLLEISEGKVYQTSIRDIQKGASGTPGGMEGIIIYNNYNILGNISKNTECGIYGQIDRIDTLFREQTPVEVATVEDIEEGDAVIRCAVNGTVEEYKVQITKIDSYTKEANKGLVLEITDEELLDITGGIVQGMSGSPILQNGKLIGAVTHVFVNDPTKGYGIFAEKMVEAGK